jgi:transcriptional regulator with XRE-family HTH domain
MRGMDFPGVFRHASLMDKAEHGRRLKAAIGARGLAREDVALAANVKTRTVTNWTSGETMPNETQRIALRVLFPGYDDEGDLVERAVRHSELTEDRQDTVLGFYKRQLREQREERVG